MKSHSITLLAVICLTLLLPLQSLQAHQEPVIIKILFGYHFPPYYAATEKRHPSKHLTGNFINILENFKKSYPQYKLEYKCLPRARISKVLKEGGADAFALSNPMFIEPEIKSKFIASVPLWKANDHLISKKGFSCNINCIDQIIGRKIAILHGNGYGPLDNYFANGLIKTHPVYSTPQILTLVHAGRVDYGICNKETLPNLIKKTNFSLDDFEMNQNPLYSYTIHLIVSRSKIGFLKDFNSCILEENFQNIK